MPALISALVRLELGLEAPGAGWGGVRLWDGVVPEADVEARPAFAKHDPANETLKRRWRPVVRRQVPMQAAVGKA